MNTDIALIKLRERKWVVRDDQGEWQVKVEFAGKGWRMLTANTPDDDTDCDTLVLTIGTKEYELSRHAGGVFTLRELAGDVYANHISSLTIPADHEVLKFLFKTKLVKPGVERRIAITESFHQYIQTGLVNDSAH